MSIYTGHCYYCGRIVNIEPDKWASYETKLTDLHGEDAGYGPDEGFAVSRCPKCERFYVFRFSGFDDDPDTWSFRRIYPVGKRVPLSEYIPAEFRGEFEEAVSISELSPKGSAALFRRLLQRVLREHYQIRTRRRDLNSEIEEFINRTDIPQTLKDSVDAIRAVGNFAAHPLKSTNTGEIQEVEPGEVEWLTETMEELFDFAFIRPARLIMRREALNKKQIECGKDPIK